MVKQKTFVMLKPDCIHRGHVGEVINRMEIKGWRITEVKSVTLEPAFLYTFYEHIKDQPYFLEVFNYMLSGVVLGMVVEGENVIKGMRKLIGSTITEEAQPGTIRGDFAVSSANSLIHASRTTESFKKEYDIFFGS